jgi:type I restriction enzyme, S subunit
MAQRTRGAAVKGINLGDLRMFPLVLPPEGLQAKFASTIRTVRKSIESGSQQVMRLEALFFSLQSRAFSGQL